jgi:hypothetical protein
LGNISNHPEYAAVLPSQSASVPVCSTVLLPSPSRPTQKLEKVFELEQVTVGIVQPAATLVNVLAAPAAA